MLLLIILIGLIALGIFLFVKIPEKYMVFSMTLITVFAYLVILGGVYMFTGTPNGYEEPVLTAMYELLPVENAEPLSIDGKNIYAIKIDKTESAEYHVCAKRLDITVPKSVETYYSTDTNLVYGDECVIKVYDVVAKPSVWTLKKAQYNQYEICVPEESVLKIIY